MNDLHNKGREVILTAFQTINKVSPERKAARFCI